MSESVAQLWNVYPDSGAAGAAAAPVAGAAYTAWQFGDGDRSLEFWRAAHWPYFVRELAELGIEATRDMPVVCERFEVVYRSPAEGASAPT